MANPEQRRDQDLAEEMRTGEGGQRPVQVANVYSVSQQICKPATCQLPRLHLNSRDLVASQTSLERLGVSKLTRWEDDFS